MSKVCEGVITSPFGKRVNPITGEEGTEHNGVDIGCPVGTPVYAPAECIVMQVYDHDKGGKTIILRDVANNDRFGFCHLAKYEVRAGTRVKKGQLIALSGNTGASTGPHLHFSYGTGGYWKDGVCKGFKYENPVKKIEFD